MADNQVIVKKLQAELVTLREDKRNERQGANRTDTLASIDRDIVSCQDQLRDLLSGSAAGMSLTSWPYATTAEECGGSSLVALLVSGQLVLSCSCRGLRAALTIHPGFNWQQHQLDSA